MFEDLLDTIFEDDDPGVHEQAPEEIVNKPDKKQPGIRHDLVQAVRERVRNRYYDSDLVVQDLTHEFARALNQKI